MHLQLHFTKHLCTLCNTTNCRKINNFPGITSSQVYTEGGMIASQGEHQQKNDSQTVQSNVGKCLLDYGQQATAVSLFDDAAGSINSDSREHKKK